MINPSLTKLWSKSRKCEETLTEHLLSTIPKAKNKLSHSREKTPQSRTVSHDSMCCFCFVYLYLVCPLRPVLYTTKQQDYVSDKDWTPG